MYIRILLYKYYLHQKFQIIHYLSFILNVFDFFKNIHN